VGDYLSSQEIFQQWAERLNVLGTQQEDSIRALTFVRGFETDTKPALLQCDDAQAYVVKGVQSGRKIVNDHVVARLGELLKAPVGKPMLINISPELIEIEPRLSHFAPGLAHGTLFIPDCIDRSDFIAISEGTNRARFALLAVLYGWVQGYDQQFLYRKRRPQLVYSVDHSFFFPFDSETGEWSPEILRQHPQAVVDPYFSTCGLKRVEIHQALQALASVTEDDIFEVVATLPEPWGITMDERIALVEYLIRRKQELLVSDPMGSAG
jgi:hypothetical protein